MAWRSDAESVILTSESCLGHVCLVPGADKNEGIYSLGLELVRQDQVGVLDQAPVRGHDVVGDVQLAVVAHDGVQDPEEAAGPTPRLFLELLGDVAHGLDGGGARHVARQHHVEPVEVRLLQALPEVRDLLRRYPRASPLPISGVVACACQRTIFLCHSLMVSRSY